MKYFFYIAPDNIHFRLFDYHNFLFG